MRYFRCLAGDEAYEQIRLTLDSAWGHPNAETKTVTCIDPAAVAPRDTQGRILLAVNDEFVAYPPAAEMLPGLLAGGAVEEITEEAYRPTARVP
jgi:hypothetical protein